jgi:hypothetical protein
MGGGRTNKQNSMIYPVMENLAENLQGRGFLLLTRNLDPGKRYFSDDPENLVQPGIFCSLGQFGELTLLAGVEINWYRPGKIYMGVLASETGFALDQPVLSPVDPEIRKNILEQLNLEAGDQKITDRWIWWRYLTADGRSTENTADSLIPHFKDLNPAVSSLADQKNMVKFITAAADLWSDLLDRRIGKK